MKKAEDVVEIVVAALKQERLAKGMSHDNVAEKTGLNRSTISLIESGKRQPRLLSCLKIAAALEIDLGALIQKMEKE